MEQQPPIAEPPQQTTQPQEEKFLTKECHTFKTCLLISVAALLIMIGISYYVTVRGAGTFFSCVMGILSLIVSCWTVCTAYSIKDHVEEKLVWKTFRDLFHEWDNGRMNIDFVPEDQAKNARNALKDAQSIRRRMTPLQKQYINSLSECLAETQPKLNVYLNILQKINDSTNWNP